MRVIIPTPGNTHLYLYKKDNHSNHEDQESAHLNFGFGNDNEFAIAGVLKAQLKISCHIDGEHKTFKTGHVKIELSRPDGTFDSEENMK